MVNTTGVDVFDVIEMPDSVRSVLEEAEKSIEEYRLPLAIFSDPELHRIEQIKLFGRVWNFLAHENEIPNPGDYIRRYIGNTQIIVVRGEDGRVRAFLNICRHKGMSFTRAEMGNASFFRCPYHGFTYNNKGELIGVPFRNITYGEKFDPSKFSLIEVRVETYNGLIFGNLSEKAPPLSDYLENIKFYLDIVVNRSDAGLEISHPERFIVPANWKVFADNFSGDIYHFPTTHRTLAELKLAPVLGTEKAGEGYVVITNNAHGADIRLALSEWAPQTYKYWWPELIEKAKKKLTSDQFELWSMMNNLVGQIFPNFVFIAHAFPIDSRYGLEKGKIPPVPVINFRLWRPISHNRTEVWVWKAIEADAPEELKKLSLLADIRIHGSSGLVFQDDIAMMHGVSESALSPRARDIKLIYEAGMYKEPVKWKYPGMAYYIMFDEHWALKFWKTYIKYMLE